MKKSFLSRLLAVVLCFCMLPVLALAEEANDGTPVTRADLSLKLNLYPEGFPDTGAAHYEEWARFLDKVTLEGRFDTQSFLMPLSRMYFDGGLHLNGENKLPFVYDTYYSFRYLRSPALRGEHLHFQMVNFFQFMLKGYYYMDLPTNLIAVPMYPEAFTEFLIIYWSYFEPLVYGEGDRTVAYQDLYDACAELSSAAQFDIGDRLYYLTTCLLSDIGAAEFVQDKLRYLDAWLDYLDPEQKGMQISVNGDRESWVLGDTEIMVKDPEGWTFSLPDDMGYLFTFTYRKADGLMDFQLLVTLEEEERLNLTIAADGLQEEGWLDAQGRVQIGLTGGALYTEVPPIAFDYRYSRSAAELPCHVTVDVDWIHPETDLPAIGFTYDADVSEEPYTVLKDLPYDHQDDFFHLNEGFIAEYKERYLPTIALHLVPFVLEMPAGVISDTYAFLSQTGLLGFLGIE